MTFNPFYRMAQKEKEKNQIQEFRHVRKRIKRKLTYLQYKPTLNL